MAETCVGVPEYRLHPQSGHEPDMQHKAGWNRLLIPLLCFCTLLCLTVLCTAASLKLTDLVEGQTNQPLFYALASAGELSVIVAVVICLRRRSDYALKIIVATFAILAAYSVFFFGDDCACFGKRYAIPKWRVLLFDCCSSITFLLFLISGNFRIARFRPGFFVLATTILMAGFSGLAGGLINDQRPLGHQIDIGNLNGIELPLQTSAETPSPLSQGRWTVTFLIPDCKKCREYFGRFVAKHDLPDTQETFRNTVAAVEYLDHGNSLDAVTAPTIVDVWVPAGYEISIPREVWLEDGIVAKTKLLF